MLPAPGISCPGKSPAIFSKVPILRILRYLINSVPLAKRKLPTGWEAVQLWPAACCQALMSAIVYRVKRKSGDYIKTAIVAANHSEEPHFGVVDGVVVSLLLLCVGGLVCLLVLS
jgi:hypothetical protein